MLYKSENYFIRQIELIIKREGITLSNFTSVVYDENNKFENKEVLNFIKTNYISAERSLRAVTAVTIFAREVTNTLCTAKLKLLEAEENRNIKSIITEDDYLVFLTLLRLSNCGDIVTNLYRVVVEYHDLLMSKVEDKEAEKLYDKFLSCATSILVHDMNKFVFYKLNRNFLTNLSDTLFPSLFGMLVLSNPISTKDLFLKTEPALIFKNFLKYQYSKFKNTTLFKYQIEYSIGDLTNTENVIIDTVLNNLEGLVEEVVDIIKDLLIEEYDDYLINSIDELNYLGLSNIVSYHSNDIYHEFKIDLENKDEIYVFKSFSSFVKAFSFALSPIDKFIEKKFKTIVENKFDSFGYPLSAVSLSNMYDYDTILVKNNFNIKECSLEIRYALQDILFGFSIYTLYSIMLTNICIYKADELIKSLEDLESTEKSQYASLIINAFSSISKFEENKSGKNYTKGSLDNDIRKETDYSNTVSEFDALC